MWNGITSFQQPDNPRQFGPAQDCLNEGSQDVQRLTAEKVHGSNRFEKERGRRCHAAPDDGVGDPFEQGYIFCRKGLLFWSNGEGVSETGSKILGAAR